MITQIFDEQFFAQEAMHEAHRVFVLMSTLSDNCEST